MPIAAPKQALPLLRGRIAPTPSGFLHQGNAFSFVLTWLLIKSQGGVVSLRIDDADTARARPEYIEDIFEGLQWLGLDWDEGPRNTEEFKANFSQVMRFSYYQEVLNCLRRSGKLYACNCSRSQIREQSKEGIYTGHCITKRLPFEQEAMAWRVQIATEEVCFWEAGKGSRCLAPAREMGDFVVRRKGGVAAYQIASLADDLAAGTNLLVRGEDLLFSSAAQVYLAQLLGQQEQEGRLQQQAQVFQQAVFLHHPLVLDEHGHKLSKSAGSSSLKSLREAGGNPLPIYARVAAFLQLPQESAASLSSLLQEAAKSPVALQLLQR